MNFASFAASSTTSAIITYSYDRMAELPQTLNILQRPRLFGASGRLTSPALFTPPSADNATYYYQIDGNKNVTELTDASGAVVAHYEYSPFGAVVTATGTYAEDNPFRFSSEYYDSETGLVYYNYRYYSPNLGRWLKPDQIEEYGGWNLYAMVKNNIFNVTDRLGLKSCCDSNPPEYQCCSKWEQMWELLGNSSAEQCTSDIIGETWWGNIWVGGALTTAVGGGLGKLASVAGGTKIAIIGATPLVLAAVATVPVGGIISTGVAYSFCTKYYCTSAVKAKCNCTSPGIIWDTWTCNCPNGTTMVDDYEDMVRTFKPSMTGETDTELQKRN